MRPRGQQTVRQLKTTIARFFLMDYFKYQVTTDPANNEVLIALMSLQPFDTFVENETGFEAFLPKPSESADIERFMQELQTRFDFKFSKHFIKGQNWNEVWESNFNPIQVGGFCGLRAGFHPPMAGVEHELIITPKMAFGTGHHETTFMMIQLMQEIDFKGRSVLDYGCGTGVLAILASKLGAASIDAVDIEQASYQNTLENCVTNKVANVNAFQGTLNTVDGTGYGIVLANINRNVILDSLKPLSHLISKGGTAVFSGFVKEDQGRMQKALAENGFAVRKTLTKNNWMGVVGSLQ